MTVRDISEHLSELYGDVGHDTVSRVTNAVLEGVAAWRTRPLEAMYPIAYFDCLMVKVREDRSMRSRACYLAIGVTVEGDREVLRIRLPLRIGLATRRLRRRADGLAQLGEAV